MNQKCTALILFCCGLLVSCQLTPEQGKHLFILSGQSNMAAMNPAISFTPALEATFGKENVVVVKQAASGQPIYRWVPDWQNSDGAVAPEEHRGDLYRVLHERVAEAASGQHFDSVTLIWMQGESDAVKQYADVYQSSFEKLVSQIERDLKHTDMHVVIGRISDFDDGRRFKDWPRLRDIQVQLAESKAHWTWVNTDDLNDNIPPEEVRLWRKKFKASRLQQNDLHYSEAGYGQLGSRFADAAIQLIQNN